MNTSRSNPTTLAGLLQAGAADHVALVAADGPALSYARLHTEVEAVASALRGAGVGPGSVVSIMLGNDPAFVVVFLAVARAGAVAAPLNPGYPEDEFLFSMRDAGARLAILAAAPHPVRTAAAALGVTCIDAAASHDGAIRLLKDGQPLRPGGMVEAPSPETMALFLHTSGTTSRPKGVPLTHGNLTASIANIVATYRLTPADTVLAVMPLFHVHGLIGVVLSTLATGGTVVVPPRFSAGSFWPTALKHRATWYSAVPTIHQILIARAEENNAPTGAFRFIRSCSAALTPALFERIESRFGAPVLEAYGMTEASHQMASNPLPPGRREPGSVWRGTGTRVAIMDDAGDLLPTGARGEVVIQGPNVMRGYKDNPTANAASFTKGWFRTGDQGALDEDGYLRLTGRLKELINRGGEKISPLEVDAVLARHPLIAEAITFGVPDAKYGEEVHAAVVLKGPATEQEIRHFCLQYLADFKVPKVVHFVKEVPRTATGKVQRRQVAAHFGERA